MFQSPLGFWQARNWDPEVGSTGWDTFCAALDGKFEQSEDTEIVAYDADTDMVTIAEDLMVPVPVYNYAKYIKKVQRWFSYTTHLWLLTPLAQNFVSLCPDGQIEEVGVS